MSMVELIKRAHTLVSNEKRAFQPMPGGQVPPMAPPGGMPMDPSMMGGAMPPGAMPPVDPATGMPMDPAMMGGGMPPVDPATGMPMDPAMMGGGMPPVDPATGMPMDPAMAGGDPAAEEAAMEEQLRTMIREEVQAVLDGQAPPSDKKPEEGTNSEIGQKLDLIMQTLGIGDTAAPAGPMDPMAAPADPMMAPEGGAGAAEPQMEKMQSARGPKTIAQVLAEGARRAIGGR